MQSEEIADVLEFGGQGSKSMEELTETAKCRDGVGVQFRDGGGQRMGGVRGDGRCSGMRLRLFRGGGLRLSEGKDGGSRWVWRR